VARLVPTTPSRAERLRLGMRLQDVSDATGIPLCKLAAAERGECELTPEEQRLRATALRSGEIDRLQRGFDGR